MSGVLFIITIPTERQEQQSGQFKNRITSSINTNKSSSDTSDNFDCARNSSNENLISKVTTKKESVSINIDEASQPGVSSSSTMDRLRNNYSTSEAESFRKVVSMN